MGRRIVFVTNNSGRTPEAVAQRLAPPEPAPEPPRHPEVESSPLEGLDTFDPGGLDVETSSGESLVPGLEETTFGEDTGAGEAPVEPLDGLLIEGAAGLERGMPAADDVAAPDDFLIERAASADEIVLDAEPAGPSLDLDPAFGTAAEELDDTVPDAFNLLPDADLESPSELEPPPELGSSAEPMYADDFDVGDTPLDFIATGDAERDETHAPDGFAPEPGPAPTADAIASLEDRILENPEDPALHRDLAAALAGAGDSTRAIEEYSIAVTGFEAGSAWESALDAVDAILALEPDAVRYQQKRVELAYRTGDRARLLSAYLDLADTLVRAGASDKAAAVYGRILEHDPANARAREAMSAIAPPEPPPAPERAAPPVRTPETPPVAAAPPVPPPPAVAPPATARRSPPSESPAGFVDLGSMVIEEEGPRDTRMRYQHERPTGDEHKDFLETLAQLKKGIEANLGTEDYEAHYDLGVASH